MPARGRARRAAAHARPRRDRGRGAGRRGRRARPAPASARRRRCRPTRPTAARRRPRCSSAPSAWRSVIRLTPELLGELALGAADGRRARAGRARSRRSSDASICAWAGPRPGLTGESGESNNGLDLIMQMQIEDFALRDRLGRRPREPLPRRLAARQLPLPRVPARERAAAARHARDPRRRRYGSRWPRTAPVRGDLRRRPPGTWETAAGCVSHAAAAEERRRDRRRLWGAELQSDAPGRRYDDVAAGGRGAPRAGSSRSTSSASRYSPAPDRARDRHARRRALRLREGDELRAPLRRALGGQPEEPRLHGSRARRPHRQPVPRSDADAPAAALPLVERRRRREHARRRRSASRRPAARAVRAARVDAADSATRTSETELETETPVISPTSAGRSRPCTTTRALRSRSACRRSSSSRTTRPTRRSAGCSRPGVPDPVQARAGRPLHRRQPACPARANRLRAEGGRAAPPGLLRRPGRLRAARGAEPMSRRLIDEIFRVFARVRGGAVPRRAGLDDRAHAPERVRGGAGRGAAAARRRCAAARLRPLHPRACRRTRQSTAIDTQHEEVAHRFLAEHFGEEIAEPIRLHVAAKRYLCAVEPSYLAELSPASVHSLELQGGPYGPDEIPEFEASPYAEDAVRLRR